MNKLVSKNLILISVLVLLAVFLFSRLVWGWTNPTANPPGGGGALYYSGNKIGIGTSNPAYLLTVSSSTDLLFGLVRSGATNPVIFKLGTDSALIINASSTDVLTLKSGNVGIGTTGPGARLHVADPGTGAYAARFGTGAVSQFASVDIIANSGTNAFQVWDDNALTVPRFIVQRGGNVGINNPTPNSALDVTGQINATGDICTAVGSKCLSTVGGIPSGMIAMFDTNCPAGWTRFSALDNRVPLGNSNYGGSGGSNTHTHSFNQRCGVTGDGGAYCYVRDASVTANNLPPYLAVIWCKKD